MQVDGYSLDAQWENCENMQSMRIYKLSVSILMRDFRAKIYKDGTSSRGCFLTLKTLRMALSMCWFLNFPVLEEMRLMISVLSAVAEIERENIRTQTMAGREQKAREGKWNGGFAPYGYKLENGQMEIAEDE